MDEWGTWLLRPTRFRNRNGEDEKDKKSEMIFIPRISVSIETSSSSLFGIFYFFQGPFIFEKDGLEYNPHTWNQRANILYVEQPAGVGFSFGDKDAGDYDVGDERASIDNYQLIVNFLNRFPNLKENEFYIASESYGGHYIPHCE